MKVKDWKSLAKKGNDQIDFLKIWILKINQDIQNMICNNHPKLFLQNDFATASTYRMRHTVNLIFEI